MTLEELDLKYESVPWSEKPNKLKWPKNLLTIDELDEFNRIYKFCDANYMRVDPTRSGGMPYHNFVKFHERYFIKVSPNAFEICLMTLDGCYRFLMYGGKIPEENCITGSDALKVILKTAEEYGVRQIFEDNSVDPIEGKKIKAEIKSPYICLVEHEYRGQEFDNVHHIDFNSSYASRIVEAYPELKPMYDYLYEHRKEKDGYYKHVLTNSIGCMQSKYCIDINSDFRRAPYSLAAFSKIAINGNNDKIDDMMTKLIAAGRKPLLINTDGIWYQGEIYHDENEHTNLCGWKNDHKNCRLYIKSSGAYQYIEDGAVHSVVRGFSRLDALKPDRSKWLWREIDEYPGVFMYKFDEDEGVIKEWVDGTNQA